MGRADGTMRLPMTMSPGVCINFNSNHNVSVSLAWLKFSCHGMRTVSQYVAIGMSDFHERGKYHFNAGKE